MRLYKKLLNTVMFVLVAVFSICVFSANVKAADEDMVAFIGISNEDWSVQYFYGADNNTEGVVSTTAEVTGRGQYTVGLDFTGTEAGVLSDIFFWAVDIKNGEQEFSEDHIIINEIKVNGETLNNVGATYTTAENNDTRVNLTNPWAKVAESGRSLTGTAAVTPNPVNVAEMTDIETIEITFTIGAGIKFDLKDPASLVSKAYLQYASKDWGVQYWYNGSEFEGVVVETVDVSQYFTDYTVSLDFTGTENGFGAGIAFLDVEILNGEHKFPTNLMVVKEVLINGEEVELGEHYTTSDNKNDSRVNLYNEWVAEINEGRTFEGLLTEEITAIPVGQYDETEQIETIEVTFSLEHGAPINPIPEESVELPEEGTKGYFVAADEDFEVQYWGEGDDANTAGIVVTNPVIKGYGQYTAAIDFTGVEGGVLPNVGFLGLEIGKGEDYFPYSYIRIDSFKINGVEVDLGVHYVNAEGKQTRLNFYNIWVEEISEGRVAAHQTLAQASAKPLYKSEDTPAFENIETIEITFTITVGAPIIVPPYEMPESFRAFMMYSSEEGGWERYTTDGEYAGDALVTGDGTYTVYIKAADFGWTEKAKTAQVFLIDIVDLGEAMVHLGTLKEAAAGGLTDTDLKVTVKVFVDGVEVQVNNSNIIVGDIEGNGRLRLELYNIWGSGTADKPVVNPELLEPESEIKVEFTLEGTGIDSEDPNGEDPNGEDPNGEDPNGEDPNGEDPSDVDDKDWLWLWISLGVVALVGVGAVVYFIVIKKK
ncbi:MAG: hypothetical protein ACOX43_05705 [Bacilli bacterium]|jgi:hypothetical protein